MKKLNKYDVRFLLQSLTIAGIAILIWTYFYSGQINKNYLNISLSEEEAKQKAMQYLGSRAWDITGYKYSSKYTKGWVNWWIEENYNINYTKENLTDKDLDEINNINKLTGENRWNMRWYNPPSSEEYRVSFTKDGDLAFFQHIMPDSLSGDSLPGDIAYNIAIMFLKNMTKIEWQEKDWKLQIRRETQRDNRLDHYFQWENKLYGYYDKHEGHADKSTIRMSIQVHGSQVARYNSWLEVAQDTNKEFVSWAFIKQFLDRFQQFVTSFIVIISLLVSLFYFKISTNWKIAARYTIFLFCIYLIKGFLEIPWNIYDFSSEDSFLGSIAQQSLNILLDSLYFAVSFLLMVSACEKLYRYIFPNHLSFANIINPSSYSSKLFLNNYSAGIVFSLCILAFTGIYYSLINSSGYYIAFPHLDFNQLLTYNPLLYILSSGIHSTLYKVLPYILLILFFYLLTSSKVISISIASLLVSIQGALDTDPIFWGSIYLFIIGIASGYILFKFGIVSLIVSTLSVKILSAVFLYFYTTQLYFITTGVIVILFLISPLIYFLLYQLKHGESRDSSDLLNSSIPESEHIVSEPIIPHIEPTQPNYNKWGLVIFIIGILCLFVPNNNKFNELFYFKVSKSEALEKTKNIIEKDFKEDLTDFEVGIAQTVRFWLGNSGESLGPFSFYYSFISPPIALLNEKVGRNGIVELTNKYDISLYAWFIRFFKPDEKEGYRAAINSKTGQMHFYQNILSDSTALPSVTEEGAINIIKSNLKSQNIDISSLPIDRKNTTDLNVRLDQSFGYKKELTLDTKPIIDQMIHASVAGNKFQFYTHWLDVDEEWQREYTQADIMYIFTQYLPLILLIVSMLFGLFFLIKNSTANRKNISWNLISILLTFVIFVMITDYINSISVMKAWYWSNVSWLSYWLNSIGHNIPDIAQLAMYVIIPTSCAYLINPSVKNLFSQASLKRYSKDAFISSLATLGAVLLFRPIEYIIYSSFPHYIDLSFHFFDKHDLFAQSVPGYGLFLKVAIETWILFAFSIFFYHQFMKYSKDGKKIQKYLLLAMVSLFYLFNGTFLQSSIFMIPHFLYRFISLIIFLVLIKYFWKLNPLCHLFGILFYFKLDDITSFIAFADPTIKSHGWALIICLVILFISTVGIGAYRSRLSSDST